jgi:prepilin-type N-terminal cleavage/methylation domain-containing protein
MRLTPLSLKNTRAFSLIELVITIVVVSIIAVPLALFIFENIENVFKSEDLTLALDLARLEMETVNNLAYTSINSASYSNYQGYAYDVTRTMTYAYGTALTPESVKKIVVEVKKSGSAAVLVNLVTYIAKNISYGI